MINVASIFESSKPQLKVSSKGDCRMQTLLWLIPVNLLTMSRHSLLQQKGCTPMDPRRYFVRINAPVITPINAQFGRQRGLRVHLQRSSNLSKSRFHCQVGPLSRVDCCTITQQS